MGTNENIPARESRTGEEPSARRRLAKRAVYIDAFEAVAKESQTVLITLLSCRI